MQHQIEQVKPENLVFVQAVVDGKRPQQYRPVFIVANTDVFFESVQIGNPFPLDQVPVIKLKSSLKRIEIKQKRKQGKNQKTPDLCFYAVGKPDHRSLITLGAVKAGDSGKKEDRFKARKNTPEHSATHYRGKDGREQPGILRFVGNNVNYCVKSK